MLLGRPVGKDSQQLKLKMWEQLKAVFFSPYEEKKQPIN